MPESIKAIKVLGDGKAEVQHVPVPALKENTVLVKVKCVALNPVDWQVPSSVLLGTSTNNSCPG
jgi:NADPH:quinone reductase-like Zn-dependent oxidoreductase